MQANRGSIAVLFALWLGAGSAPAGEVASDIDFQGIRSLRVTASPMPQAALDCNIEPDELVRDLERQLEAGGLKNAAGNDNLATITVLSAHDVDSGLCSSALMLGAYSKASFFADDAGWIRSGYVVIWQSGVIATSSPEQHLQAAREALARLGDSLIEAWQKQNAVQQ
jgi:hypothetical protein